MHNRQITLWSMITLLLISFLGLVQGVPTSDNVSDDSNTLQPASTMLNKRANYWSRFTTEKTCTAASGAWNKQGFCAACHIVKQRSWCLMDQRFECVGALQDTYWRRAGPCPAGQKCINKRISYLNYGEFWYGSCV